VEYSLTIMPLLNFHLKNVQPKLQQVVDITRNRSSDSTVDATGSAAKQSDIHTVVTRSEMTPPASPSHPTPTPLTSWRTKDDMSSIVRSPPRNLATSQEQEDMWTLRRCDAFDEDDC